MSWTNVIAVVPIVLSLASITLSVILWRRSGDYVVATLQVPTRRVREEKGDVPPLQ